MRLDSESSERNIVTYISLQHELKRKEGELKRLRKQGIDDPQRERVIRNLKDKLAEMDE